MVFSALSTTSTQLKYSVDSVTCLEAISQALTSGDLFSAISNKILPPVRNVSRSKALAPFQRTGLTQRNKLPKKLPIHSPR
jgi:hypothetical protein